MLILLAAAAVAFTLWRIGDVFERTRREAAMLQLLETFGPAAASVQQDYRQLLVWYPLAQASRKIFPEAFEQLDKAAGGTFPFTKELIQAAHARCTSEWLTWERAHDAEYSVKTAEIQQDIDKTPGQASPLLRTRLAAVEQQKLERYQQRYEEYIKTAKALNAHIG
jgi:hypothetical protein